MTGRIELLDEAIDTMADLIDSISPEEFAQPTPCTEYTVGNLVDHLVSWIHVFEAATGETDASRDPKSHVVEDDHGKAFRRRATPRWPGEGTRPRCGDDPEPHSRSMVLDMMTWSIPVTGGT